MEPDLIIVGAGISGLGLAHMAVQRGLRPLLLEASGRVGGLIHSHKFEAGNGYWAELGAHTGFNSYGNLLQMLESEAALDHLKAKRKLNYRLLGDGRMGSIAGALSYPQLLASLPNLFRLKREGLTARQYFGGLVGQENFTRVLGPALDAVICQPAADFPADALFIKKQRRKEIVRSFTGPAGIESLLAPLLANPGIEWRLNCPVHQVGRCADGFRLTLAEGETIETPTLVLAIAPDIAARLLQGAFPELAGLCRQIPMAEIETLGLLLPRNASELPEMAGIIARDDSFYSAVTRDYVADSRYRAFSFHFRPGEQTAQQRLQRALEVLGVRENQLLAQVRKRNRLPSLRLGQRQLVASIDRQVAGGRLGLVGNWFSGVSIEDSLCRSASEFERLFPRL